MGFTGWACSLVLALAAVLICGFVADGRRPQFAIAGLLLCGSIALRIAGPAAMATVTGEPNSLTREPFSDELGFLAESEQYSRDPSDWYRELMLRRSTRFGAVVHALRLVAYDAGPPGLRLIGVIASSSGVVALWAAARRRLGAGPSTIAALLAMAWPFAVQHDAGIFREPWMSFALGWSILSLVVFERDLPQRVLAGGASSYLFYLLQPHAGTSALLAYVSTAVSGRWHRIPRGLRAVVALAGLGGIALVAAFTAGRVYEAEMSVGAMMETYSQLREGGSAFRMPPPGAPLWVMWAYNAIQYWVGIALVGMSSATRLLALFDYVFWVPIYWVIIARLRKGAWSRFGPAERFALILFALYNAISMGYVTNVGASFRKRNAVGLGLLYTLAGALASAPQDAEAAAEGEGAADGYAAPRSGGPR